MIPTKEQIVAYIEKTKTEPSGDGLFGTAMMLDLMTEPIVIEYMKACCPDPMWAAQHWAGFATALDCIHRLEEEAKKEVVLQ